MAGPLNSPPAKQDHDFLNAKNNTDGNAIGAVAGFLFVVVFPPSDREWARPTIEYIAAATDKTNETCLPKIEKPNYTGPDSCRDKTKFVSHNAAALL